LEGTTCNIGNEKFEIIGEIGETETLAILPNLFKRALFMGRPYAFWYRLLGFYTSVFKLQGIELSRDAHMQAEQGKTVDFVTEAKLGDLAFFDNEEGRITHVGIMLNSGQIIHASGRVKIDSIDSQGIYSEELKRYTHKLNVIKRYL
jgi:hypothetical protein